MAQQERRIPRDEALGLTVGDVMITNPKTLPQDARLDEDGMRLRGLLCFNRSSSRFCVE